MKGYSHLHRGGIAMAHEHTPATGLKIESCQNSSLPLKQSPMWVQVPKQKVATKGQNDDLLIQECYNAVMQKDSK